MAPREGEAPARAMLEALAERGTMIGGEWAGPGRGGSYAHHDPATGRHQADVGLGGAADVDAAVAAAVEARAGWRALAPQRRAALLHRLADLLDEHAGSSAALNALDNGTPVSAMPSGHYAAAWTRYYAGWVDKLDGEVLPVHDTGAVDFTRTEPYGVVAAIVPWNGPMMGMGQKVAPALAAGNTVVVKPPELAPFGALRYAELAREAGLPAGVLNVVPGGPATGQALVGHPAVDKISFTGGTATARSVMAAAAANCTPLALELGGKSANVVFPDADLDVAVSVAAVLGAGLLSGQGCALPTRLFVHQSIADEVVERVARQVEGLPVGDPLDPTSLVGPVVSAGACERILGVIDRAAAQGARAVTGGHRLGEPHADGYYVAPTVFAGVEHGSALATDEVFGPVLAVLTFAEEDEVIAKANDSAFGLAAYVHTRDLSRALRLVEALEVGTITVNGFPAMSPSAPFGGTKASGFGREGGRAGIEEFVQRKNVTLRY